jgi:hypothetical protein
MRKVFALEDDIRVVAQAETLANLYAALQRFPTDVVCWKAADRRARSTRFRSWCGAPRMRRSSCR